MSRLKKHSNFFWPTVLLIFKASALWVDAFYKLICPSVCLSVCVFTFEVPLKRIFASTSQSQMSKSLEI